DDADRACRARRHALGGVGDRRAFLAQRLDLHGIDVVDDQREPVLDEVQRHRPHHRAESDESDGSSHLALLYLLPSRAASTVISAFHPVNLRLRGITVCLPRGPYYSIRITPRAASSVGKHPPTSGLGATTLSGHLRQPRVSSRLCAWARPLPATAGDQATASRGAGPVTGPPGRTGPAFTLSEISEDP